MGCEAVGVTQLAHALKGSMQTVEGLQQAPSCFGLAAGRYRQQGKMYRDRLEQLRKVVVRVEGDIAFTEDVLAGTFDQRPREVESECGLLDHCALDGPDLR